MELSFLLNTLKSFGFNSKVIHLIQQCISTIKYIMLLNGSRDAAICPCRGFRQGDPLSPYLFIIGSEVLARLINREVNRNNIKGVKLAVDAPMVTKLSYADDVILFCNAKLGEVKKMMECLETYCKWSGQYKLG